MSAKVYFKKSKLSLRQESLLLPIKRVVVSRNRGLGERKIEQASIGAFAYEEYDKGWHIE